MTVRELTLDEVVAINVKKAIDKRGIPLARLAERIGVSRPTLHEMIPRRDETFGRPGRPQREFRWNEIVRLAAALEVLVFDLVLPPPGVRVAGGRELTGLLERELREPDNVLVGEDDFHLGTLDWQDMLLALFGLPEVVTREKLETLGRDLRRTKEDRLRTDDEAWEKLQRTVAEIQKMLEERFGDGND